MDDLRKIYDVCGIGNALVDFAFEVSDELLQSLAVDKGVMTLISEEEQTKLLQGLQGIAPNKACGGSAANTMIAVSQFGGSSFYSCKVSNDDNGQFYYRDLVRSGVETNLHKNQENGTTGTCIAKVTPDAERTMCTHLGITERFSTAELDHEAISKAKYLYIEGYLVASDTARAAAIQAREVARQHNTKVAITLSDPNMVQFFKPGLEAMMGGKVDLLFCNEAEALLFTETDNAEAAFSALTAYADCVAMTRGEKGAWIKQGTSERLAVPAPKIQVLDTTGAGDLFAGAFLYAITHDYDAKQATELANQSAATVVTQFGPRLQESQYEEILSIAVS